MPCKPNQKNCCTIDLEISSTHLDEIPSWKPSQAVLVPQLNFHWDQLHQVEKCQNKKRTLPKENTFVILLFSFIRNVQPLLRFDVLINPYDFLFFFLGYLEKKKNIWMIVFSVIWTLKCIICMYCSKTAKSCFNLIIIIIVWHDSNFTIGPNSHTVHKCLNVTYLREHSGNTIT